METIQRSMRNPEGGAVMPKQPDIHKHQAELQARRDALDAIGRALTTEELVALDPNKVRASNEMYDALQTLIEKYWCNKGSDGKTCPHPTEFIACITPNGIPVYWMKASNVIKKAEGRNAKAK